jgi:hypothetical protein
MAPPDEGAPSCTGGTRHDFTNPNANDETRGTVYHERADRRSWLAMKGFLDEALEI